MPNDDHNEAVEMALALAVAQTAVAYMRAEQTMEAEMDNGVHDLTTGCRVQNLWEELKEVVGNYEAYTGA